MLEVLEVLDVTDVMGARAKRGEAGRVGCAGTDAAAHDRLCERCARGCKQRGECEVVSCPKWQPAT